MPKASLLALDEFMSDKVYVRKNEGDNANA